MFSKKNSSCLDVSPRLRSVAGGFEPVARYIKGDSPFGKVINRWSLLSILIALMFFTGCAARPVSRPMITTAYCGCGDCCSWERGSWKFLKLDFWSRYVSEGRRKGQPYTGKTSRGTDPHEPYPGLFSMDSVKKPWMIPVRLVFFPWLLMPQDGTIAADTKYYRFGTRMHVPGYGWGVVEDRGGAIKGPDRLDLYMDDHDKALRWGRKRVPVIIEKR